MINQPRRNSSGFFCAYLQKQFQMKKIVVIDNYDSFTYNLVHYLESFEAEVTVFRNDEIELEELESFDKIVISPGPGIPDAAGLTKEIIRHYYKSKSILGICLGQQAIGEVFGATLLNLEKVFHGVATKVNCIDTDELLFQNIVSPFEVGRYHSWVINPIDFPDSLSITAVDENNQIMAIRHKKFDVCAVQFHPESILTPVGKTILKNWISS
jgi:anthranilate synthase component II